ncbi:sodium channel modifier 1 [Nematostella vectensis]|uniref:sodium channel modifier 1 n=1 Tax=Nematostella vectensis TaxID=45351 RepID=UPI002077348D|nr:sodium channel modifier 1 [Nematostella vectensis]
MAFKRVADDFDDFKIQKKRRVNDLLLDEIPIDEAIITKNGKLACLVCNHRPVFDTSAVLSIHRQGKKHLANVAIKLERAKQDAELKQKREHESYLKNSDKSGTETAPLLGLTNRNKIIALKTRTSSLVEVDTTNQQKYKNMPFFQPQMQFKDFKPSLHVTSEDNKNSSDQTTTTEQSCSSSKNTVQVKSVDTLDNNLSQNRVHSQGSQLLNTGALSSPCASPSKKLRAEYLVRMRQQGWIMGNDGKWRRDQDAEFDSDEEEPPHPPNV